MNQLTTHAHEHAHAHHSAAEHGHAHTATSSVQLIVRSTPHQPVAGEPVKLDMMLRETEGGMLKDFEPVHEKLAHLIIIREGLDEFAHLHPTVDSAGNLRTTYSFPQAGNYHVFVDYKVAGQFPTTSHAKFTVTGEAKPAQTLIPNVPGLVNGDGLQAEVSTRVQSGTEQIVTFQLLDAGKKPFGDLQPYLGAMGHLVVLSDNGSDYVHAHPLTEQSLDGKVEFDVFFPHPGIYKLWGQFQRDGTVYTIGAVIDVQE